MVSWTHLTPIPGAVIQGVLAAGTGSPRTRYVVETHGYSLNLISKAGCDILNSGGAATPVSGRYSSAILTDPGKEPVVPGALPSPTTGRRAEEVPYPARINESF